MRTFIGALALTAAIVLIGCSAVTLFETAYNSAQETWQQVLKGSGVVAIVAWEAGAVILIVACIRMGQYFVAAGAAIALIFAMGVTFKYELRLHVGTQADMVAQRDVSADDRERINQEMKRAYADRDRADKQAANLTELALAEAKRGGCGDRCLALNDDAAKARARADEIRARIARLEKKWDTRIESVNAGGLPEAAAISRRAGGDEQLWTDVLAFIDVLFWMFARVFALPLAIFGWVAMRKDDVTAAAEKPQEPRKATPVQPSGGGKKTALGDAWSTHRAQFAPREEKPAKLPEPHVPYVKVDNTAKKTPKNNLIGPVKRWKEECLVRSKAPGAGESTATMHADYELWCTQKGYRSYGISHFGRQLNKLDVKVKGKTPDATQAFRPGWQLKEVGASTAMAA